MPPAIVIPLLFWMPVAVVALWWMDLNMRKMAMHYVLLIGLLLGVSIGSWKISDGGLDVDVETAARVWGVWYAPAVVHWILVGFFFGPPG